MRTIFLIGFMIIKSILGLAQNSKEISRYSPSNPENTISDAKWESFHWMIERSPVEAVKANFVLFVTQNSLKSNFSGCKDGKFIGLTPVDDFGYFHMVKIEINHRKLVDIHYDELKSNGSGKRIDIDYNNAMSKAGTSPSIAYPQYENQIISKQDYMNVDAVSGATYSLYRFRMAVAKAIEKSMQD